ncbi:RNA polymerase sigma factor [Urechidicola vernalis]|uniref:RNA polymerase sigma factor n=1 Tax=Urechidicola vernalis TaxID=3075600 RepID=A0ABU2Y189_9FLAO|nr:RNA polymerase sigma factor [Urechidicola sp. P050]MDT0551948.1 RNA polymerase sigma factor [Urechidicola sp. P050]
MKEEELIKECKKNNYTAQMQLYNMHKRQVFNASWRILKNKQDAEDVLQDSFIKGFRKVEQLKDDTNIGAWFKRIAINRSLDVLRKRNKQWMDDVDEIEIEADVNSDDLIEEESITIDLIKECIHNLSEKYRVILTLYLIENYNHREISEELQLKESTVRNQYIRGKKKLKEMFHKHRSHEFKAMHTAK